MIETRFITVLCSCPNTNIAENIAFKLVEDKLAACVNMLPEMKSIYRWQGKIESAAECLLIIKTTNSNYNRLESYIKEIHPYECPEIISLSIEQGNIGYLEWIKNNTMS